MNKIYREAARLIAEGEETHSCLAIQKAKGRRAFSIKDDPLPVQYAEMFGGEEPRSPWDSGASKDNTSALQFAIVGATSYNSPERQHLRVMLLLFAAEIFSD